METTSYLVRVIGCRRTFAWTLGAFVLATAAASPTPGPARSSPCGSNSWLGAFAGRSIEAAEPTDLPAGSKTAIFAGGCFWCTETDFLKAPGVLKVVSGYSGGTTKNPTYQTYAYGKHREVSLVVYDPTKVTYAGLVEYLIKHVNPVDKGGSFIDRGPQYSSAIYYDGDAEKETAQRVIKAINDLKVLRGKITIPVLPRSEFWPAEEYHQDYHSKNPEKYAQYRARCGRDAFVKRIWGEDADKLTLPGAYPDR